MPTPPRPPKKPSGTAPKSPAPPPLSPATAVTWVGAFADHARRLEHDQTARLEEAKELYRRISEAEAAAARIQAEKEAAGRVSGSLAEMRALLVEYPDLARALLEEAKGLAGKKAKSAPPDGAAVKVATEALLAAIADRLDELEDGGLLDIDESDTEDLDQLQLTRAEWEFVKRRAIPELFAPRPRPEKPTSAPPGSPKKIEEMTRRVERNETTDHPEDADLKGAVIVNRANGAGKQVLGLAEDLVAEEE